MASDNKQLLKAIRRAGYQLDDRGGHIRVRRPTGEHVATISRSPSDRRAYKNTVALLKRLGVLDHDPEGQR